MGIDVAGFREDIDGDLICPICKFVLEDPIQAPICEHVFCNTCITEWLTSNQTCPIDRTNLTIDSLKPAPRILRNFLSRLTLSCSNQPHGCPASLTLERFEAHLLECNFNPKRPVTCQSGCGMTILFEEHGNHNCIQSLKIELAIVQKVQKENKEKNEEQEEKMYRMQSELDLLKAEIDALKKVIKEKQPASSDLQLLPTVGQSQAVYQGTVLADSRWLTKIETVQNVQELVNSFVVSTLSNGMLKLVKEQLSGSGCPLEMVKTLIENSTNSRWPPGLRSYEARRANWDRLKDYRCRVAGNFYSNFIIPSVSGTVGMEQLEWCGGTVGINLIMASDNAHMEQDLFVINPGFLVLTVGDR